MRLVVLGVITCIVCVASFLLMRKEMGYASEKVSVKQWIYLAAVMIINLSLTSFFVLFYKETNEIYILKRVGLAAFVCGIMPIDLKTNRIPNIFVLAILGWRTVCLVAELIWWRDGLVSTVLTELLGAGIFGLVVIICMLVAKDSIGMGDLKLILVMAACQGLYGVMNTLFVSMIIAFFVSVVLLLSKKKSRKDTLAFAPCMMAGLYASLFLTGI